jgi:hypothetical protein
VGFDYRDGVTQWLCHVGRACALQKHVNCQGVAETVGVRPIDSV